MSRYIPGPMWRIAIVLSVFAVLHQFIDDPGWTLAIAYATGWIHSWAVFRSPQQPGGKPHG